MPGDVYRVPRTPPRFPGIAPSMPYCCQTPAGGLCSCHCILTKQEDNSKAEERECLICKSRWNQIGLPCSMGISCRVCPIFDTQQYKHIAWTKETLDKVEQDLMLHIVESFGRGPVTSPLSLSIKPHCGANLTSLFAPFPSFAPFDFRRTFDFLFVDVPILFGPLPILISNIRRSRQLSCESIRMYACRRMRSHPSIRRGSE